MAACSDGIVNPTDASRLESVSGNEQPGFVGIPLDERLVVRVLDDASVPVANAQVTWSVTSGGGSVTPSRSRSDENGIARTTWTLGLTAGTQEAMARIPGLEPIVFTATAEEVGPTCDGSPLEPGIGGALVLVGTQSSELCIGNSTMGTRDYVVVAFNSNRGTRASIPMTIQATGIVNSVGPPSPEPMGAQSILAPVPSSDDAFHARLREMEQTELAARVIAGGAVPAPGTAAYEGAARFSLASPVIGETFQINAQAGEPCESPLMRTGRVVAISQRAIVLEDTGNPPGGFSTAEYQSIATTFDTLAYPVDVEHFGQPHDIDGNGKVILFYTRAVNELTLGGSPSGFVAGFFFARDLFPRQGNSRLGECKTSNETEIMYLMVPDPTGSINGNVREKSFVLRRTLSTMAHELEHLINASRRLFINTNARYPEEVWLDEALAHSAEELAFFRASGLSVNQNITATTIRATQERTDAFNQFQGENFARFQVFLDETNTSWPFLADSPDISTRGAATWFVRYLVDRLGSPQVDTWRALVAGPDAGMRNIEAVIHADPMQWMRDYAVALYIDDALPATLLDRYRIPTWHMRSVVANLAAPSQYSIDPLPLNNAVSRSVNIEPAGSVYFRFGVPTGGEARLTVAASGSNAPGLSVVLVRTR
jgi:hypothetical protein